MQSLLKNIFVLDYEFVDAVYGKKLSEAEINGRFDLNKSSRKYGRNLNRGEIGCTLSHRDCYKRLFESGMKYILILEDDITLIRNLEEVLNEEVITLLSKKKPVIIFLSGDYWHWNKKPVSRVFAAVGSYAYLINREAADIINHAGKAFTVADDWDYFKQLGIKLYAIHPYAVDANLEDLPSDISQEHWGYLKKKICLKYRLRGLWAGAIKLALVKVHRFESKKR